MAARCDDYSFDPDQPALIVTYGNTAKKHRPLNRSVLVLGRARGCDIGLVAPDVSNLHCVLVRTPEGFLLRDCASRSGTRLNGGAISEAILRDSDILQIGPFSFQVYIPSSWTPPAGPPRMVERLKRVERSRKKLIRVALAMRRRAQSRQTSTGEGAAELAAHRADLERQEAALRERVRDCEQRMRQLEQAERDLSCDRETLDHEFAAFQLRMQQGEQQLAHRQAEVETDIRQRWTQFQEQLRRAEEQQCGEEQKQKESKTNGVSAESACRQVEIRNRELDHFAQHLRRTWRRLLEQEEKFKQTQRQLTRAFQEIRFDLEEVVV
jgi:pSer/pThr/pTyr-binding forkhead associated (FHA) protein